MFWLRSIDNVWGVLMVGWEVELDLNRLMMVLIMVYMLVPFVMVIYYG